MSEFADWYAWWVTKYESVLALALELTEEERELLALQIHPGLTADYAWAQSPAHIAELDRRMRHIDEHPESLVDWEDADLEIFAADAARRLPTTPRDGYDAFWDGEMKRRLEALVNGEEDEMEWDEFGEELMSGD